MTASPTDENSARAYQHVARAALIRHFSDVRLEWSVGGDASDDFAADVGRYAPRVDIAIGPFNTTPGPDESIEPTLLPDCLRGLFEGRPPNPNPRCLLAIEVIYSGSSKHMMGDMLNAGALGLYGMVVGSETHMPKIRRILKYLDLLARLEKSPWLFRNVVPLSATDLKARLA